MAQAPKLSHKQWGEARSAWEADQREGFAWLVKEMALPVSAEAVRKRAKREAWWKVAQPSTTTNNQGGQPSGGRASHRSGAGSGKEWAPAGTDATEPNAHAEQPSQPLEGEFEDGAAEDAGFCDLFESAGNGKYKPEMAGVVNRLAKLGLTHQQMADALGVAESTFYKWKAERADFRAALQMGMAVADAQVANSMYRAACGYTHVEEVIRVLADGQIVRVPTLKHYPPNPHLIMFWLKNRQPELWKERVEIKEQPTIALVDRQAMNDALQRALAHADEVQQRMAGRAKRLNLNLDEALGSDD